MSKGKVYIYDTTLRDGAQREGMSLSVADKLKIAQKLDELGVHYIEGGFPGSNPKDAEFFKLIKNYSLKAKIVAFGGTRKKGGTAATDKNIKALLDVETPTVCLVGKAWDVHVKEALRTSLEENLAMVADSVSYLKKQGREVVFDAEHFFDGFKSNKEYALNVLKTAGEAGADWLVLCDTNGGSLPSEVAEITRLVSQALNYRLGIHAHNDTECAVANSIVAVLNGAVHVQGTINGYGERSGNANLCSIIPNLMLHLNYEVIEVEQLKLLTEIAHYVAEIANITLDSHQPYVGQSAFAHKGGFHADGVSKKAHAYEHIQPQLVGNVQRVLVSELAGRSSIMLKAKELGLDLSGDSKKVQDILNQVKQLEHQGYHFEAADASFELLLRRSIGETIEFFKLESFRVIMEQRDDGQVVCEATVKVHAKGERYIVTAEGNGPVNALDKALRMAIGKFYPELNKIELTDYKVRVLDEKKGTGAVVRVLIESSDGEKSWGTIGVSENIIVASWQSLVDSINYGLSKTK